MREGWSSYYTEVDGQYSSVQVDLTRRATAPDPDLGVCSVVRIALATMREDGLAGEDEGPRLTLIEEALEDSMTRFAAAVYVGCTTGGGTREFYFYGPMEGLVEAALLEVQETFSDYTFAGGAQADEDWAQFLETLCPSMDDERGLAIKRQLARMAESGDDPTRVRPISHWLSFPDEELRMFFLASLPPREFETETLETKEDGLMRWWVRVEHKLDLDFMKLHEMMLRLTALAAEQQGVYDNWECGMMKKAG